MDDPGEQICDSSKYVHAFIENNDIKMISVLFEQNVDTISILNEIKKYYKIKNYGWEDLRRRENDSKLNRHKIFIVKLYELIIDIIDEKLIKILLKSAILWHSNKYRSIHKLINELINRLSRIPTDAILIAHLPDEIFFENIHNIKIDWKLERVCVERNVSDDILKYVTENNFELIDKIFISNIFETLMTVFDKGLINNWIKYTQYIPVNWRDMDTLIDVIESSSRADKSIYLSYFAYQ